MKLKEHHTRFKIMTDHQLWRDVLKFYSKTSRFQKKFKNISSLMMTGYKYSSYMPD